MSLLRGCLVGLVCLGLGGAVHGADGTAKESPPWRRLLQGADARKAQQLQEQIDKDWAAGRFEEALRASEAELALRRQAQGAGHWQAVKARWQVESLRRILNQDGPARERAAVLPGLAKRADAEEAHATYRDAQRLREQILAIDREVLGEDCPATARSYYELAFTLHYQGKYGAAEPLCRKALAIHLKVLGKDDPYTGRAYDCLADDLEGQEQYAAAAPLYREALTISRRALGEDHSGTALGYRGLGKNLHARGKYAAAEAMDRKALAIARKVLGKCDAFTAWCYLGLALDLQDQGNYAAAEAPYQKALAINRKVYGEDHAATVQCYSLLADLRRGQGMHPAAEELHRKALGISRRVLGDEHPLTVGVFASLALDLEAQGNYGRAQPLLQQVLAARRRLQGEDAGLTIEAYIDVAANLDYQGNPKAAEQFYQKADQLLVGRVEKQVNELRQRPAQDQALEYRERAQRLHSLVGHYWSHGQYERGLMAAQELLAWRQKVQGAAHWQSNAARWQVDAIRRILRRDAQTRGRMAAAPSRQAQAAELERKARYGDAQPLREEILALCCRVLGDEHPITAACYAGLGNNQDAQGKYAAAERHYQRALSIDRRSLGEQNPDTAASYLRVADGLSHQGNYAAAEPFYKKALAIYRNVLGEDDRRTANAYDGLANSLYDRNQYAAAQPLYEKALAIRRKTLGEEHPDTAGTYSNLAGNLRAQDRPADAARLYRHALAVDRKVLGEGNPRTAHTYIDLARTMSQQGRYAAAQPLYEKGLQILRAALGEEHPDTGKCYTSLASNLGDQGQYQAAETCHRRALAILRKALGDAHPDVARGYGALGVNLWCQGKYAEAESGWTQAAEAFLKGRRGLAASGLERAVAATQRSPLTSLAAVLARNGKPELAWQRFEESIARGTWDELSARLGQSPAERERQAALARDLARLDQLIEGTFTGPASPERGRQRQRLLTQRERRQDQLEALARQLETKYGPAGGQVFDQPTIQKALPADTALVGWIDVQYGAKAADPRGDHWGVVLRARGKPAWVRLRSSGPGGAWTNDDTLLPGYLRAAMWSPRRSWRILAGRLRQQRLEPLAAHLAARDGLPAVRRLIVLPSANMTGVPVELCAEGVNVSYAMSGTLCAHLSRQPPPSSRGLLALADPVFESPQEDAIPPSPRGTRVEAEALRKLCRGAGIPFRLLADSDASEQELDRLTRSKELATYRYIHLATHGELDDRRPLQSAVFLSRDHLPDPLKQLEAGQPVYDGRLTAEKVLEHWDLHAELVTVSACETALGKYEGGEGFVGFTQALLLSGARSVCLSLWRVDDTATALLMQRFHANLLGQRPGLKAPLGKVEALAEAKAWLRNLSTEEAARQAAALTQGVARGKGRKALPALPAAKTLGAGKAAKPYAHPYYWAAFVLVGNGD
jgi:CHAT domain-containing protein/tetratricopeptide (TPR) repeat protein